MHVIPTDDWYERGKKATDRCDLELTQKIQGAENGLEDKVVWVSALFDLKVRLRRGKGVRTAARMTHPAPPPPHQRGEAGMGDFQRGMDEYYRRFQIVLDRGFQMIIFIPTDFEKHLKIDYTRVKVIYMNATDLKWYLPYYDRVQSIRCVRGGGGMVARWLLNTRLRTTDALTRPPPSSFPQHISAVGCPERSRWVAQKRTPGPP